MIKPGRVGSRTDSGSVLLLHPDLLSCTFSDVSSEGLSLLDEGETLLVQRWTQEWSDEITLILAEVGLLECLWFIMTQ